MTLIISPTIQKIRSSDVKQFLEENPIKKHKLNSINPDREIQKKSAEKIFRTLCPELKGYMDSIVTNTGLKLSEVLGQYWFKTIEGKYISIQYDTFGLKKGNRKTDPIHIAELINDIRNDEYAYNNSFVDEHGDVGDGQHRLIALKMIQKLDGIANPFIFDIVPNGGIKLIKTTNNLSADWDLEDHLSGGIGEGNRHYLALQDIHVNQYEKAIPLSELIQLLDGGHRQNAVDCFRERTFTIEKQRKEGVIQFIEEVQKVIAVLEYGKKKIPGSWFRVLYRLSQIPGFKYATLIKALKNIDNKDVRILRKLTNFNEGVIYELLLKAYNYGLKNARLEEKSRKTLSKEVVMYETL